MIQKILRVVSIISLIAFLYFASSLWYNRGNIDYLEGRIDTLSEIICAITVGNEPWDIPDACVSERYKDIQRRNDQPWYWQWDIHLPTFGTNKSICNITDEDGNIIKGVYGCIEVQHDQETLDKCKNQDGGCFLLAQECGCVRDGPDVIPWNPEEDGPSEPKEPQDETFDSNLPLLDVRVITQFPNKDSCDGLSLRIKAQYVHAASLNFRYYSAASPGNLTMVLIHLSGPEIPGMPNYDDRPHITTLNQTPSGHSIAFQLNFEGDRTVAEYQLILEPDYPDKYSKLAICLEPSQYDTSPAHNTDCETIFISEICGGPNE